MLGPIAVGGKGDEQSLGWLLGRWLGECEERAWTPALLAVREASMPLYESRGFSAFYLGDEAVIDCASFTLDGRRNKSMRQSVSRVARTHRFVMLREVDAPDDLVRQLNALSDRWRGRPTPHSSNGGHR